MLTSAFDMHGFFFKGINCLNDDFKYVKIQKNYHQQESNR
jgi:hypothetical protein